MENYLPIVLSTAVLLAGFMLMLGQYKTCGAIILAIVFGPVLLTYVETNNDSWMYELGFRAGFVVVAFWAANEFMKIQKSK